MRDPLKQPFLEDATLEDLQGPGGGQPDLFGLSQVSREHIGLQAGPRASSGVRSPQVGQPSQEGEAPLGTWTLIWSQRRKA